MTKRALLVLIGGRQIPNVLTAQYLRPNAIVPVASHEALQGDTWSRVQGTFEQLCPGGVAEPIEVNAFDLQEMRDACSGALALYPDAEWTFNITSATTVMSIGAYEIGKERGASVWYLNSAQRQVVCLAGKTCTDDLYNLSVAGYMQAYGRNVEETAGEPSAREIAFAQWCARYPQVAMAFRDALRKSGGDRGKDDQARSVILKTYTAGMLDLCRLAQETGLLPSYQELPVAGLRCAMPNSYLWRFMDGKWLEIYAWEAAREARIFDDCRMDVRIPMRMPDGQVTTNELDLALTHAASLIIAECKTEDRPFDSDHLYQLHAIANMVGGNFVSRIFITSQVDESASGDPNRQRAFESFRSRAEAEQIVVVTGGQLEGLSSILEREAKSPRYART